MKSTDPKRDILDFETIRLFLVLGLLTIALVLGLRWALFAPPIAENPGAIEQLRGEKP